MEYLLFLNPHVQVCGVPGTIVIPFSYSSVILLKDMSYPAIPGLAVMCYVGLCNTSALQFH